MMGETLFGITILDLMHIPGLTWRIGKDEFSADGFVDMSGEQLETALSNLIWAQIYLRDHYAALLDVVNQYDIAETDVLDMPLAWRIRTDQGCIKSLIESVVCEQKRRKEDERQHLAEWNAMAREANRAWPVEDRRRGSAHE